MLTCQWAVWQVSSVLIVHSGVELIQTMFDCNILHSLELFMYIKYHEYWSMHVYINSCPMKRTTNKSDYIFLTTWHFIFAIASYCIVAIL